MFGGSRLARNRSNSSTIKQLLKKESVNTKVVCLIVMFVFFLKRQYEKAGCEMERIPIG